MLNRLLSRKSVLFFLGLFIFFSLAWCVVNFVVQTKEGTHPANIVYAMYFFIAIFGAINGLRIARKWGGWHSKLGVGLIFLSLGLLSQGLGGLMWNVYVLFLRVEVPYPSLADIGYFGIIPFNALALINFGYLAGARFSLRSLKNKTLAIGIGLVMFGFSYFLFLQHLPPTYQESLADGSFWLPASLVKVFLDYGYPLGEAFNVTLAIGIFAVTAGTLGGIIRRPLQVVILYFLFVFATDTLFLWGYNAGIYYNGSWIDMSYTISQTLGAIALILFEELEAKPV